MLVNYSEFLYLSTSCLTSSLTYSYYSSINISPGVNGSSMVRTGVLEKNGCGHVLSIRHSLTFATQGLCPFFRIGSNTPVHTIGGREGHYVYWR